MADIEPMIWEEAETLQPPAVVVGSLRGTYTYWYQQTRRAIALASQEKERADRAGRLAQAAEALLSGLEQAWEHEKPLFSIAFAHGVEYKGPDLSPNVQAVKEALRAYQEKSE